MKTWTKMIACVALIGVMSACEQREAARSETVMQDKEAKALNLPPGLICPPVEPVPDGEGWSLGSGTYRAVRTSGDVIVYANGLTPTPGYTVRITQQDPNRTPPHLTLYWKGPPADTMVAQVLTRYQVCARIPYSQAVETVILEDIDGEHELKVERVK